MVKLVEACGGEGTLEVLVEASQVLELLLDATLENKSGLITFRVEKRKSKIISDLASSILKSRYFVGWCGG